MSKIIWTIYKFFYLLFIPSAKNLEYNEQGKFYIIGFFSSNLSHRTAADLLILELEKKNIEFVKVDISEIHFQTQKHIDNALLDGALPGDNIVFAVNPDIFPMIYRAFSPAFFKKKYLIGYWVYELDKLPFIWQLALRKINELWVPSRFVKQVAQQYSKIKIKIIPHAVGLMKFETNGFNKHEIRQEIGISDNDFLAITSFSFSSSMERKNIIGTIQAFEQAFGDSKDVLLIIRYINETNFPASFQKLTTAVNASSANIILYNGNDLGGGAVALYKLYFAADVLLSLHRAEGFGLQIAEAMRFNLPAIATYYSGNTDFMTQDNSLGVGFKLVKVKDDDNIYNLPSSHWAEPDLQQAASYLKLLKNDSSFLIHLQKKIKENCNNTLCGSPEI